MPIKWETHSTPRMGNRPQAIINEQLVGPSDILIGVFWTRIGTDTGASESGTVEEIEEFKEAKKHVLLYFSSKAIPQDADLTQYQKVKEFKKRITDDRLGLFDSFSSISELEEKLDRHLTAVVSELKNFFDQPEVAAEDQSQTQLTEIKRQLFTYMDTFKADWTAEKMSHPNRIDDGKRILKRFGDGLLQFRSQLLGLAEDSIIPELDRLLAMTRTIQSHEVYIDGGVAYRQFWYDGDNIFEQARSAIDLLQYPKRD
jgi:hypothetical protein